MMVSLLIFAKLETVHQKRVTFTVYKIIKSETKKSMRYDVHRDEDLTS